MRILWHSVNRLAGGDSNARKQGRPSPSLGGDLEKCDVNASLSLALEGTEAVSG